MLSLQYLVAILIRIRNSKKTVLISASGKMVMTGAKSEDDSHTHDGQAHLLGASDAHPLAGGPRIEKEVDEGDLDGDSDGQYHHYPML